MQLTKNFNLEEFKCKDGTPVPKEYYQNLTQLVDNLQTIRDHFNLPIIIISGYRTKSHNKKIGGAPNSLHLTARAADFKIKGISPEMLYNIIEYLIHTAQIQQGGLGIYKTHIHYDIRKSKARWKTK